MPLPPSSSEGLAVLVGAAQRLLAAVPLPPVTREDAAEQARRELANPEYREPLLQRVAGAVGDLLDELLSRASAVTPGRGGALLVAAVLLVVLVLALRGRVGPLGRSRTDGGGLDAPRALTADDLRRSADEAAAAGRLADAVRERLRAMARDLETRGLLLPQPGRTAGELAAEAGALLPALGEDLRDACRVFEQVWYGGRQATAPGYARVRDADGRLVAALAARAGAGDRSAPVAAGQGVAGSSAVGGGPS